jgi:hypothetical protein
MSVSSGKPRRLIAANAATTRRLFDALDGTEKKAAGRHVEKLA